MPLPANSYLGTGLAPYHKASPGPPAQMPGAMPTQNMFGAGNPIFALLQQLLGGMQVGGDLGESLGPVGGYTDGPLGPSPTEPGPSDSRWSPEQAQQFEDVLSGKAGRVMWMTPETQKFDADLREYQDWKLQDQRSRWGQKPPLTGQPSPVKMPSPVKTPPRHQTFKPPPRQRPKQFKPPSMGVMGPMTTQQYQKTLH